MVDFKLGTPIICKKCGYEDSVRLTRGTRIKSVTCLGCGNRGSMIRNTEYDKRRRNVLPKFPKKHGEIHPIYYQKEIEKWRVEAIKFFTNVKTQLEEILTSELMKQAEKFVPRVKDRWEGQLFVINEVLEALK